MCRTFTLLALFGLACGAPAAPASEPGTVGILHRERVLTRPLLPTDQALAPLGLKKLWYLQVPVEGTRDGLATVQVIGPQVVVRTFGGLLLCLDAETGATQWRTYLGKPYAPYVLGVGNNEEVFLVMSDLRLYALNRRNGNVEWTYDIPGTPMTHPAADKHMMFIGTNEGRVRLLQIPQPRSAIAPTAAGQAVTLQERAKGVIDPSATQVMELWSMMLEPPLPQPPIFTDEFVLIVDGMNQISSYDREKRMAVNRFVMRDRPAAPMASLGEMVYVASRDRALYALELDKGFLELRWKFIASGWFTQRPFPCGADLFIGVAGSGVYCFDREAGQTRWVQPRAERFLSASSRLVFALSADKQLLIIDRARGLVLAQMDARNYAYGVQNLYSDRFLLANHDGTLIAFRDVSRDSDKPAQYQVPPPKKIPPVLERAKPAPPGEGAKEEDEMPKKKPAPRPPAPGKKKMGEEEEKPKGKKEEEEGKKGEEEEMSKDKKKDNKKDMKDQ